MGHGDCEFINKSHPFIVFSSTINKKHLQMWNVTEVLPFREERLQRFNYGNNFKRCDQKFVFIYD